MDGGWGSFREEDRKKEGIRMEGKMVGWKEGGELSQRPLHNYVTSPTTLSHLVTIP